MLLRIEFIKLWRKPRTYIGFGGMAAIIGLMLLGLRYGHPLRHAEASLGGRYILAGSFLNAEFVAHALLPGTIFVLLPLFTAMVFGDLLASEAAEGTMRTMLCRPVSRVKVGAAKYLTGIGYVLILTFGAGLAAFLAGWLVFGRGWLLSLDDGIWVFKEWDAIPRLIAAYGMASASMLAVGSIAFALSSFLSNANGSIIGAMSVMYALMIVGQIDYFDPIKPYLFTSYLESWRSLFVSPIIAGDVYKAVGVMLAYSAVFMIIGLVVFRRKDVLA